MNAISLTTDQKAKLYLIIAKLFPATEDQSKPYLQAYDERLGLYVCIDNENGTDRIHWFEFCMTHLVNRLYYPNMSNIGRATQEQVKSFFWQSFVDSVEGAASGYTHPIDYLYDKFQSIINK